MKRFLKMVILGSCVGGLVLFIKIAFHISNATIWKYYLIFSAIVIGGTIGFNLCYNFYYQKKMNAAAQLYKADRIEEYIVELERMRSRAKGRFAIALIAVNLSAGYSELKRFDKAIEILQSISDVKLSGVLKVVYRINLCSSYFYQKQTDRAMEVYENSQKIFAKYRDGELYGGNIAILDIYAAISRGDYAYAGKMLKIAQETWKNSRFLEDYQYFEDILQRRSAE